MMRPIAVALVVSVLSAPLATGQESARDERVDALCAEWDRDDAPGAVVGVYRGGELVHARGYGSANLDLGVPLTPRTVLRIGSISKQFVAMCIVLLAEDGALELDDDVREHLPELRDYGAPITLRNLLHHTSGIREYLSLLELIGKPEGSGHPVTPRELLELIARQEALVHAPGEEHSYSNSNYFLLSEVVTRVSGTKTSAFAKARIFDPLAMTSTRFSDDPTAIVPNRAWGYSPLDGGGYRMDILLSEIVGDLGVVTTVEDFLQWDRTLRHDRLGSGSLDVLATMLTRGRLSDGEELDYALGIEHGSYRGLRTLGHDGAAVGYVSEYLQFPDHDLSIVVFANDSSFGPGRLARRIAELYLADRFTEPAPPPRGRGERRPRRERPGPVALSPEQLETFAGDYYGRELHYVYPIAVRGDALVLEVRGRSHALEPLGDGVFRWGGRRLEFDMAESGTATGFGLSDGDVRNIRFRRVTNPLPTD